jgi:hypothetical protein
MVMKTYFVCADLKVANVVRAANILYVMVRRADRKMEYTRNTRVGMIRNVRERKEQHN